MTLESFNKLTKSKQENIMKVATKEFAIYGYNNSSTNRIVKEAKIGKGSLFKYFLNKEQLYFDVLDYTINDFNKVIKKYILQFPKDVFGKIIAFAQIEISWHIENPIFHKLIKDAFTNDRSEIHTKIIAKYGNICDKLYEQLLNDLDVSELKVDQKKATDIFKWFICGFNKDYIENLDEKLSISEVKKDYIAKFKSYLEIYKTLFINESDCSK
ncbi:TetR/AcrR family transcriptional regulator [Clostridiaceae bacterium M8S5]|nr:TetR/AcrR family transcriptional regulator [Clostridiaceae bacterium M8S5]